MNAFTLLVAEDTDSNYDLVSILFRKEYNVIRAISGLEAVRLYLSVHPDLILMDIRMPEISGLDATRLIRDIDKNVPIIAITAYAFEADRRAFIEAGGTDYLPKPVDPYELKDIVKRYLC